MTDLCTIGPVSIEHAHLFDTNTFSFSNSASKIVSSGSSIVTKGQFGEEYGFELICSYDEALQLKGLVEQGELVWMNTSDLTDNDYMQHKGWVVLTSLTIDLENPTSLCNVKLEYIKISDHDAEYLTMDYSRGVYDGINLTPTYNITTTSYQLQEDGSDATTNWSTIRRYPASGAQTFTSDGAEFDLALTSAVDGTWKNAWVICDTYTFTPPFTLDIAIDRNSLPGAGSYPASLGFMFSPHNISSGDIEHINKKLGDYLEFQWNVANGSTSFQIAEISAGNPYGTPKFLLSNYNFGTSDADYGIRVTFYANGNIRVWKDTDVALSNPVQIYYGPSGMSNFKNMYLYLQCKNRDTTSFTGSFQYVNIYSANADTYPNIVALPYKCTPITTATGNRAGEDGNIPYYTNPSTELRYTIAKADYYKGSVKLLSTNNATSTSRQVLGTDIKLTPTTTILKNAFTKLEFDADEMIVYGYDGGWQAINRFDFGAAINIIRPLFINPDRVVLQINDTKVTMLRSSPMITFEHPNTAVTYTLRDRYISGSGTVASSPLAGADIAMTLDTDYYMKIHNNASDSYSLVIGKKDPTTIKSDSLPAADMTAIGWFKKAATGINAADSLVKQWYKQTRTGISLKQII